MLLNVVPFNSNNWSLWIIVCTVTDYSAALQISHRFSDSGMKRFLFIFVCVLLKSWFLNFLFKFRMISLFFFKM